MILNNIIPIGSFVGLTVHNGDYGIGVVLESPKNNNASLYKVYCFETEQVTRFYHYEVSPLVSND